MLSEFLSNNGSIRIGGERDVAKPETSKSGGQQPRKAISRTGSRGGEREQAPHLWLFWRRSQRPIRPRLRLSQPQLAACQRPDVIFRQVLSYLAEERERRVTQHEKEKCNCKPRSVRHNTTQLTKALILFSTSRLSISTPSMVRRNTLVRLSSQFAKALISITLILM